MEKMPVGSAIPHLGRDIIRSLTADVLTPAINLAFAVTPVKLPVPGTVAELIAPIPTLAVGVKVGNAIAAHLPSFSIPAVEPPWLAALTKPWAISPAMAAIEEQQKCSAALNKAGWLPHELLPLKAVVDALGRPEPDIGALIDRYVADRWGEIEASLEDRAKRCLPADDEAICAHKEALAAHRGGLYRASCRTVFPEIERVVREALKPDGPSTSLKELRERMWGLPCTAFGGYGLIGLRIAEYLDEHCYRNFKTDDELAQLIALPNRHAIMHGMANYSTARDSLNVLFVADFIFHALAAVREVDSRKQRMGD